MILIKQQLNDLIQLTQLFLLQEFKMTDRIEVNYENYNYFKQQALLRKKEEPPKEIAISPRSSSLQPTLTALSPPVVSPPTKTKDTPLEPSSSKKINIKVKETEQLLEKNPIKLEPMASPNPRDFSELRNIIKEENPTLKIFEEIRLPKLVSKVDVIILYLNGKASEEILLANMAKAINTHLASAKLMEASSLQQIKNWDNFFQSFSLKLIIISQKDLNRLDLPSTIYNQNEQGQLFLNSIPILVIPDPEQMTQDPLLKQKIWNSLKQFFKS